MTQTMHIMKNVLVVDMENINYKFIQVTTCLQLKKHCKKQKINVFGKWCRGHITSKVFKCQNQFNDQTKRTSSE